MVTRGKTELERRRDQRRKETREQVSAALVAGGLQMANALLCAYVPSPFELPFSDYNSGARFQASALREFDIAWQQLRETCEGKPTAAAIDAPGVITLQKDPGTGEWK